MQGITARGPGAIEPTSTHTLSTVLPAQAPLEERKRGGGGRKENIRGHPEKQAPLKREAQLYKPRDLSYKEHPKGQSHGLSGGGRLRHKRRSRR